ncbi:hypothetical protein SAMN05443663_108184 [Flavobacterium defluvii]|uniref:Uncharacterized protein n=1 Tax=Flavobacterium defluvii TaxID=370979 RepID=A0A1M5TXB1_9FLAO|nr:hypothetical protein SAMN05443663_108184 [Flavobacterium defluvii]
MMWINKIKILIVGLTTVLSLIHFSNNDFKKEIVQNKFELKLK